MQVTYPIIPEKTAAIVVDMQNDFVREVTAFLTEPGSYSICQND